MENPGEHEGCILHVPKLNTYQSSWGRRSRRTLLLLSLFISKKVQFKTLPKSDHCLSSHSRRRNTVPPTTHIALTHGPTCSFVYQCPRSRLFVCSRETRHLVLSSSFRLWIHAVALPSLQYQESRNSDLFSAIPITTRMGSMPSVAQAGKAPIASSRKAPVLFLVGLPSGQSWERSRGGFGGSRRAWREAGGTPGLPVAAVHVVPAVVAEKHAG